MSYITEFNSFILLLDINTPLNPIQKAIKNAEINKELDK